MVKRLPAMRETLVQSLGWEDSLEEEMATRSSTLAWKLSWTEEPGRLQSMGWQRVRHDWVTSLSLSFPLLLQFTQTAHIFVFLPMPLLWITHPLTYIKLPTCNFYLDVQITSWTYISETSPQTLLLQVFIICVDNNSILPVAQDKNFPYPSFLTLLFSYIPQSIFLKILLAVPCK